MKGSLRSLTEWRSPAVWLHGLLGRQRTYTIGKHGSPWSPDTARQEARRVLGEVAKGGDPVADQIAGRKVITVAELCRQYLIDGPVSTGTS